MVPPSWTDSAAKIHASGRHLVIAVTGGGSSAIAALLQTPGASRSVLEAIVPYSHAALADFLGAAPDQACSSTTARHMAMAAFLRARKLAPAADPHVLVGVGCTASLATDRPKRGERRVHVAMQTAERSWTERLWLGVVEADRPTDEVHAGAYLLWRIARACGIESDELYASFPKGRQDEALDEYESETAQPARTELLLGQRLCAVVQPHSSVEHFSEAETPRPQLIFPGAFNPVHRGHLQMAALAEKQVGAPLLWEISIANVDKPPLDFIAIRQRVQGIRFEDHDRPIALTRASTFREKAELFPGGTFVVGVDTLSRIADPQYYGDDEVRRNGAIDLIAAQRCQFLVFSRVVDDRFQSLGELALPPSLRALCIEVPAKDFREDISSTELRRPRGD